MSELEELRALVREVIRDVLPSGFPGGLPVTETVNLSTDEDLAAFVQRLLDLDPDQREELRSGLRAGQPEPFTARHELLTLAGIQIQEPFHERR